jgi:hypothetical protein
LSASSQSNGVCWAAEVREERAGGAPGSAVDALIERRVNRQDVIAPSSPG